MTFNSVKEVIDKTDLKDIFTFVDKGLWFTHPSKDEFVDGKGTAALGVKSFTETITVPPEIYRKPQQLEQYKSNMYFRLAKKLLDELFTPSSTSSDGIISITSVAGVKYTEPDPVKAYDLVKGASYVNGGYYFNNAHAVVSEYSSKTQNLLFDRFFNADSSKTLAFGIADGAYYMWLSDVEEEEHFEMSKNEHKITATIFAQGYPSLAPVVVEKE